jgi:ribonuclease HI
MIATSPHYLLFSESSRKQRQGQWRFVLQSVDGAEQFEAADEEPEARGERLELLAVVRGLEALDQPSRVTLITPSKYVNRGIAFGLKEWRSTGWQWERFGEMVPVKNRDLWQRVDRALEFHHIECRTWRFDLPHVSSAEAPAEAVPAAAQQTAKPNKSRGLRHWARRRWVKARRAGAEMQESLWLSAARFGTRLLPLPWLE